MNREEYAVMFAAEDQHWWYAGLRGMLGQAWSRYVAGPAPRVLDAGCGTGATLAWVQGRSERLPIGIDLSPEAIGFCRQRGIPTTARASIQALPFSTAAFDVVISLDVLYHRAVSDRTQAIAALHAVLKPGGLVILNLPAYQWLHSSHDVAVHTAHRFTRRECIAMLETAGFEVVQATYWNTLLFPLILGIRLWRKVRPPVESDLAPPSAAANRCLGLVLRAERTLLGFFPLPFGVSVFVVARKRTDGHA